MPSESITDLILADTTPFELLGPEQLDWVRTGQVDAYPGRDPRKPVLRWAAGNDLGKTAGTLVKGSGVSPGHVDASNGRRGAVKQTNEYIALMQRILAPTDGSAFEDVVMATMNAAIGGSKDTKVSCPECDHQFVATLDAPGDPRAQKLLMEMLAGGPTKRTETDINMRVLQADLSELVHIAPEKLANAFRPGLSAEEIALRREYVDVRANEDI